MTLASVLLQPQRIARVSADENVRLIDDVGRVIAYLVEDAANKGPVAQALIDAARATGPRLQHELEARFRDVAAKLRIRAQALLTRLEAFGAEVAAVGENPANALTLATHLLKIVSDFVGSLTFPGLRSRVQFAVDVLEKDLGISATFVEEQIIAFLDDAAARIAALDDHGDLAVRRRRAGAAATCRHLARFLRTNFHFPGFDADALARALYDLLQQAGIEEVVHQAQCALQEFQTAVDATRALGAALPLGQSVSGGGAVGAALVDLPNQSTYAWYPSWLLGDEDLPLLGLSNLENAAHLIIVIRDSMLEVPKWIKSKFTPAQLQLFANVTNGTEPTEEQKLVALAVLNNLIQGDLIYDSERFPTFKVTDDLRQQQLEAIDKGNVLQANRDFISLVFATDLNDGRGFIKRAFLALIDWPRHQVSVSADKRFIMCDDMPLLLGENLKWYNAPIFANTPRGQTFWIFAHVSPDVCEGFAHHLAWLTTLGKAVWHLVDTIRDQPGHRIGSGIAVSLEFAEALNELIFGRPINGYDNLGDFGRWLASSRGGPRGLAILLGTLQGIHTAATAGNITTFWLTIIGGDVIRTAGPASRLNLLRDLTLGVITLINFGGPRDGPSKLPTNPAQNHLKQGPINTLMNTLFGLWLVSYYKREDHSIEIWSKGGISTQRERAFKLWLGGGIGMGIAAGVATTLVAQIMAWAEDWALFGKTVGFAALTMVGQFWLFEYLAKENDTAGGTYNPRGPKKFKGYPNKDSSPYRLPFANGESLYCGQANQGMWSHNDISNISSDQQCYAYDFGHDHQQAIHAARDGVVWAFTESNANTSDVSPNFITVLHDAVDGEHDSPFGTGTVTTYARYLHGASMGITNAFASRGQPLPVAESASRGNGTRVKRGDVIMLADDTGKSFHSHLHMHVVTDNSGGVVPLAPAPAPTPSPGSVGIPFVFKEVRGDGNPQSLTWYTSENG